MVTEGPIRGVAPGGVSVGVGSACRAAADHLAADPALRPSIWLERGGRLRCMAGKGEWPGIGEIAVGADVVGATSSAAVDHPGKGSGGRGAGAAFAHEPEVRAARLTPADDAATEVAGHGAAAMGVAAAHAVRRVCLPIRCTGTVVGLLAVELARPLRAGDPERFRRVADGLGRAIAELGGPPAESAPQRLLRHMASLSALDDPVAIAAAVLQAACELMGLESGALVDTAAETGAIGTAATGRAPLATTGPLGELLAATPGAIRLATDDGTAHLVPLARLAAAADHGAAARLRAAGARTLVTVGLSASAGGRGALLLAGMAEAPGARGRAVSIDDLELLELLAAHAATCLRTADLVRSLRERAATDPLTGLGHHATFHEALARTHRRPQTAVVLVDVDGFKRVNDTHGHQHGDHVLRSIAHALGGALRRGDTLYRVGGDEFAALLAVGDAGEAHDAGLRLRAAVAAAELGVTVSIGVAVPQEGEPDGAVLDRADRALYRVKDAGRDGVAVAPPEAPPVVPPV